MRIVLFSVGLFLAAFLIHWLLWQVRVPKRQTRALLLIFLGSLLVSVVGVLFLPNSQRWAPIHFWEWVQVVLFHVSLSLAYIVIYSTLEEHSPTLTLVKYVADAGERGRSQDDLETFVEGIQSLGSRLHAMRRDAMITEERRVFRLTAKGSGWARVFQFWRRLLRIDMGG
jgi:hypothetical protein